MNLRRVVCVGVLLSGIGAAQNAEAKLLDVYASTKGGFIAGSGANDLTPTASDYFDIESGPGLGFEVGAEVLFLDFMINGTRIFDASADSEGDSGGGFFFQFLTGLDGDFRVGDAHDSPLFLRAGVNTGVALGTHRRVKPPLDNAQVSDKGFVFNGVVALDYHLGKLFVLGVEFSPGYHYFFPGGDSTKDQSVNGNDQSQGMHMLGMAFLQFHLDPTTWEQGKSASPPPDLRPATYASPPPATTRAPRR